MNIDSNYEMSSSNDFDESSIEFDNDIADFELHVSNREEKSSKHINKRNFNAKKKIEELQEQRRLRSLDEGYYDDWD